jgi:hypothetical protein
MSPGARPPPPRHTPVPAPGPRLPTGIPSDGREGPKTDKGRWFGSLPVRPRLIRAHGDRVCRHRRCSEAPREPQEEKHVTLKLKIRGNESPLNQNDRN